MSFVRDGILGLVLGDALGVPYEFKVRDTFRIRGLEGYGIHNQPAGTWSDDSSMTLATVDSLVVFGGSVNLDDIMDNFCRWYYFNEFTPHGGVFDIGGTTICSIYRYSDGENVDKCGMRDELDNGNGSIMRILPLAFVNASDKEIEEVSALTHGHEIAVQGCQLYVMIAKKLMEGKKPVDAIRESVLARSWRKEYERIERIEKLKRKDIKSSGYVVSTLEAALWALVNSSSYLECVYKAINLGGDTDSIGAVAGGLAGIVYGVGGFKGIPKVMLRKLARIDYIESLCEDFEKVVRSDAV